jgi:polysaccharide pyruvyl transferase WcaK-like protein
VKNRIFIYGYHGLRNIGAESRLIAIVNALRAMVPATEIVVNSFHRTNLAYLRGATVDYFHPATYRLAGRRRIAAADALILSEGNMLTEAFTKHMLVACITALEQARALGVASVGLALDSGTMSPTRRDRVVRALDSTALLTVRAPGAAEELRTLGVTTQLPVTADCAPSMPLPNDQVRNRIRESLGFDDGPVHGIAPVDFFMYPARMALVGRREDFVRWPFKATWPDDGRQRSERLVENWAAYGQYLLSLEPRARVALIVMDPSDIGVARRIRERIACPERTMLLAGVDLDPFEMSAALGELTTIATSRYHALVMPLAYAVPYVALGHDTRTRFISEELGVSEYFVAHDTPDMVGRVSLAGGIE